MKEEGRASLVIITLRAGLPAHRLSRRASVAIE